jgi:type I restriction enzyme S subunit
MLIDIADVIISNVDKKTKEDETPVRLCNYTDVYYNQFIRRDMAFMSATAKEREIKKCSLFKGDVIITKDSETADDIGVPAYVRESIEGLVCGYHLVILRPKPNAVDGAFLFYALSDRAAQVQFHAKANGITRFGLRKNDIETVEVPIPPLPVQRQIGAILGSLEDKIDLNRRMNRTLEKMAAAIFKSWFIDFDPVHAKAEGRDPGLPAEIADLFPDIFEDSALGPIPKGWTVAPMKDLADVNARSIKKDYPHARIRYVDISSVSQGSLDQTTTYDLADAPSRAKRLVQTGDTIWSCVRPNRKAYLYIDRPADNLVVSTGFAVLSPRAVPASYLHQWVTTQAFVDYLTAYATGAAYPAVKADTFETAKMLLPDKGLLKAFHDLVGPLLARIAHNQRQNRRLAGLRDTLLPKLLSGEIELPAAEALAEGVK